MIDEVDGQLRDWIAAAVGEGEVSLGPPRDPPPSRVGLYLLEVKHVPVARGSRRPPLQVFLRYLVTTWSEDPLEAHRVLGQLLFAALEHDEFEVEMDPIPTATWSAFGVAPRPSFVLRVPMRRERPQPPVKHVRKIVLAQAGLGLLEGHVVGPGDEPIMNARVEFPALDRATWTDSQGRFRFVGVPAGLPITRVRVSAKGVHTSIERDGSQDSREPLIIRLPISED